MWGRFERKQQENSGWSGFLEKDVRLEGKLESSGTLRIDSTMKGTLASDDTLILGEHACVEGELAASRVVVEGRFDGTIHARARVEIRPNAIVTGEIHTPCLAIEPGGIFDGQCHMPTPSEAEQRVTIPIRSTAGAAAR